MLPVHYVKCPKKTLDNMHNLPERFTLRRMSSRQYGNDKQLNFSFETNIC